MGTGVRRPARSARRSQRTRARDVCSRVRSAATGGAVGVEERVPAAARGRDCGLAGLASAAAGHVATARAGFLECWSDDVDGEADGLCAAAGRACDAGRPGGSREGRAERETWRVRLASSLTRTANTRRPQTGKRRSSLRSRHPPRSSSPMPSRLRHPLSASPRPAHSRHPSALIPRSPTTRPAMHSPRRPRTSSRPSSRPRSSACGRRTSSSSSSLSATSATSLPSRRSWSSCAG